MTDTPELSIEYRIFLERRRADIKDVLEGVLAFFPPEALEENHLVDLLKVEFDTLSFTLDLPDLCECLDRWMLADGAEVDGDDEWPDTP